MRINEFVALLDGDGELGTTGRHCCRFGGDCLGHFDCARLLLLVLRVGVCDVDIRSLTTSNLRGFLVNRDFKRISSNLATTINLDNLELPGDDFSVCIRLETNSFQLIRTRSGYLQLNLI